MPFHGDDFGSTKTCSDRNLGVKGCWGQIRQSEISPTFISVDAAQGRGGKGVPGECSLPQVLLPSGIAESARLSPPPSTLHVPVSV